MSSFSEIFHRASRLLVGTAAFAAATGGGMLGSELAHEVRQPELSVKTFYQELGEKGDAAAHRAALQEYRARIERMAAEREKAATEQLQKMADQFAQDLRIADNLSERDYAEILGLYDQRVGLAPSAALGNVKSGIGYNHECQIQTELFSFMTMDSMEDDEKSDEIGQCMADNSAAYGLPELGGGLGGAILGGGLILVPALRRKFRP